LVLEIFEGGGMGDMEVNGDHGCGKVIVICHYN
jgi:hypothetical protein